ncbi:MAG: hypothetical protein IKK84_00010 [Clostridia bacterium]|nr:hypothetical protein [Clostridia bacterium]
MSDETFLFEHQHYCKCGCDEPMSESICKYKGDEWRERTCKGCGRTLRVGRFAKNG